MHACINVKRSQQCASVYHFTKYPLALNLQRCVCVCVCRLQVCVGACVGSCMSMCTDLAHAFCQVCQVPQICRSKPLKANSSFDAYPVRRLRSPAVCMYTNIDLYMRACKCMDAQIYQEVSSF
jgi:hypothetical protein